MNDNSGRSQSSEPMADKHRVSLGMSPRTVNFPAVQVIASDGRVLNPCHPARARELIRKQRAVRISRQPYTIQLLLSLGEGDVSTEATDSPEASP